MSKPTIRWCKQCCEPDTRPDCIFDDEGVCYPCRYHATFDEIDWDARRRELEAIADWGRAHNTSGYDCIIGVSGGKDSHRQALYARDELGLKPLLVSCTYPPQQQTERGARNLANMADLGFDLIAVRPAPEVYRRLVRWGIVRYGNWCKSTELCLYASVPKVAVAYHIPLIFLGENPALSWGSAGGSLDGDANRMKYNNTLQGGNLEPILSGGVTMPEIFWYIYPSDADILRANLRMVYLGYFIRDFNDYTNARIAIENGMSIRKGRDAVPEDMGQINDFDALDDDFVHLNQMLKYLKFGFGKASEQCSGAIRNGVMTREEALEKVARYDGKCADRYVQKFCDYIGMPVDEFWAIAETYRNHDIWTQDAQGQWHLKDPIH